MRRNTTHLGTLAIALACAVVGTLLAQTGVASAEPPSAASSGSPRAHAAASRGFRIYNLSSHRLKLLRVEPVYTPVRPSGTYKWPIAFEGRPEDGDVLMPGAPPHIWEVKYRGYAALARYAVVGTDTTYSATMMVYGGHNDSICWIGVGACTAGGLTLIVTDPPETVRDIPASEAQQQAAALRALCTKTNSAKCRFAPVREEQTNAPSQLVGEALSNCGDSETEATYTANDEVEEPNSVGVKLGAESERNFIFEKVKSSIEDVHRHTLVTEHSFSQDMTLKVKPGNFGWVSSTSPVLRNTGDFTLTLGETTWKLRGVYFDTPDPGRPGQFLSNERKMTPKQVKECEEAPPGENGLTQTSAAYVLMERSGTHGDNVLRGGRESNTLRGLAGHDTIRGREGHDTLDGGGGHDNLGGGSGRDTLNGGPGHDTLHGGPGRDTLIGGPGPDTMTDNGGPTLVRTGSDTGRGHDFVNVRDGRGDDTVVCGTRRTTVLADRGDRVTGDCGGKVPTGTSAR